MSVDIPKYYLTRWFPVSTILAEEECSSKITIQNTLTQSEKTEGKNSDLEKYLAWLESNQTPLRYFYVKPRATHIQDLWKVARSLQKKNTDSVNRIKDVRCWNKLYIQILLTDEMRSCHFLKVYLNYKFFILHKNTHSGNELASVKVTLWQVIQVSKFDILVIMHWGVLTSVVYSNYKYKLPVTDMG